MLKGGDLRGTTLIEANGPHSVVATTQALVKTHPDDEG